MFFFLYKLIDQCFTMCHTGYTRTDLQLCPPHPEYSGYLSFWDVHCYLSPILSRVEQFAFRIYLSEIIVAYKAEMGGEGRAKKAGLPSSPPLLWIPAVQLTAVSWSCEWSEIYLSNFLVIYYSNLMRQWTRSCIPSIISAQQLPFQTASISFPFLYTNNFLC